MAFRYTDSSKVEHAFNANDCTRVCCCVYVHSLIEPDISYTHRYFMSLLSVLGMPVLTDSQYLRQYHVRQYP